MRALIVTFDGYGLSATGGELYSYVGYGRRGTRTISELTPCAGSQDGPPLPLIAAAPLLSSGAGRRTAVRVGVALADEGGTA